MRVLLDTNVVISAILFEGVPRTLLEQAIRGEMDLVTSPVILNELEEILARKFGFAPAHAAATRAELESLAETVVPDHVPRVCRDPDDDQVLAAATAGRVEVIVTGDKDLLEIGSYEGVEIVTPSRFVAGQEDS